MNVTFKILSHIANYMVLRGTIIVRDFGIAIIKESFTLKQIRKNDVTCL